MGQFFLGGVNEQIFGYWRGTLLPFLPEGKSLTNLVLLGSCQTSMISGNSTDQKIKFSFGISSVNVTKSAGNWKTSFFVQCRQRLPIY